MAVLPNHDVLDGISIGNHPFWITPHYHIKTAYYTYKYLVLSSFNPAEKDD